MISIHSLHWRRIERGILSNSTWASHMSELTTTAIISVQKPAVKYFKRNWKFQQVKKLAYFCMLSISSANYKRVIMIKRGSQQKAKHFTVNLGPYALNVGRATKQRLSYATWRQGAAVSMIPICMSHFIIRNWSSRKTIVAVHVF